MTIDMSITGNVNTDLNAGNRANDAVLVHTAPEARDGTTSMQDVLDQEFKAILIEEIHNAVQEIIRTQKVAIGIVREDFRKIMREVLEEKILAITENLKKST